MKAKLGNHSSSGVPIVNAMKWWAEIPVNTPISEVPTTVRAATLWVNRKSGTTIEFSTESYGYYFDYKTDRDRITLKNLAEKARVAYVEIPA